MVKQLHLVVDEPVWLNNSAFRVQVWRGAGLPPAVVCIQLNANPPPKVYTTALAQIAVQRFLGYSRPLPSFFQFGWKRHEPEAFKVVFETTGNPFRPILMEPVYHRVEPAVIARIFGLEFSLAER